MASAFERFKRASAMTMMPAVLKKVPFHGLCAILREPKESSASTGNVPSAKTNIVSAPCMKLPVDKAYSCIDCVNPQGKKNVPMPTKAGAR